MAPAKIPKKEPKASKTARAAKNPVPSPDARTGQAGYALGLVKALVESAELKGRLEAGRQSRGTIAQTAVVVSNMERTHSLLLRWMRDYVEGKV